MDSRPVLTLADLPLDCLEAVCLCLCREGGNAIGPSTSSNSNPAALAHLATTCSALRAAAASALARLTHLDLTPPRIVALIPRPTRGTLTRPPTPAELGAATPLIAALLSKCTAAASVDLSRGFGYVSDATLDALGGAAEASLRTLRLSHCTRLTAPALARLAAAAPFLAALSLAAVPAAGEMGALDGFTALEDLDVAWVRSFGGGSTASPSSLRLTLTRAALRGCEGVGDAALATLLSPALTHLDLAFTAVSDAGLAAVAAGAPSLRTLVVANSERCDEIWSTGFYSAGGLRRFRAAAPGVTVVLVAS